MSDERLEFARRFQPLLDTYTRKAAAVRGKGGRPRAVYIYPCSLRMWVKTCMGFNKRHGIERSEQDEIDEVTREDGPLHVFASDRFDKEPEDGKQAIT